MVENSSKPNDTSPCPQGASCLGHRRCTEWRCKETQGSEDGNRCYGKNSRKRVAYGSKGGAGLNRVGKESRCRSSLLVGNSVTERSEEVTESEGRPESCQTCNAQASPAGGSAR